MAGSGRWTAHRPLKPTLVTAGVVQALVTLIQLAPFVLLTELARRMLDGASSSQLWNLGGWAIGLMGVGALLASALTLWLHTVDARFERDLRQRLLGKLAKLPLGWFTARDSGRIKRLVQDDTLSLHYLITHAVPDAAAAVVAPRGLRLLERVSERGQVIVVGDDGAVGEWAKALGDRAAIRSI